MSARIDDKIGQWENASCQHFCPNFSKAFHKRVIKGRIMALFGKRLKYCQKENDFHTFHRFSYYLLSLFIFPPCNHGNSNHSDLFH